MWNLHYKKYHLHEVVKSKRNCNDIPWTFQITDYVSEHSRQTYKHLGRQEYMHRTCAHTLHMVHTLHMGMTHTHTYMHTTSSPHTHTHIPYIHNFSYWQYDLEKVINIQNRLYMKDIQNYHATHTIQNYHATHTMQISYTPSWISLKNKKIINIAKGMFIEVPS